MDRALRIAIILSAIDKMSGVIKSGTEKGIKSMTRLSKEADKIASKSFDVGRSAAGVGLAFAAPLGMAINAAAEMETMNVALKTSFQGNEQAAAAAFDQINDFAAKTPYEMGEVMNSFIKLKNMGLDPSVEALTAYGNTASGMGKDLNSMIEAVADAATGEFERLKEFGIRSKSEGDKVTFTFQGVSTTVGKNSKEIEDYLKNIGNTKFAGGIEAQSKTFKGQFSTMKDNVKMFAASIGKMLIPILNDLFAKIKPVLDKIQVWMTKNPVLTKYIVLGAAAVAALSLAVSVAAFIFGGFMKVVQAVTWVTAFLGKTFISTATRQSYLSKVMAFGTKVMLFLRNMTLALIRSMFRVSIVTRLQAAAQIFLTTASSIGTVVMGGLATALAFVGTTMVWVNTVFWANPIVWIVAIIIGAVALIIKFWSKIKQFFTWLWKGITEVFTKWWDWYKEWTMKPINFLKENWAKISEFFSRLWEKIKAPFVNFWNWFKGLGKRFYEAGANIVKSIHNGIKSGWDKMVNWFKSGIQKLRDMLPFSPAKTGPFRDLHRVKIVETIAQNIKPGPMLNAMDRAVGPVRNMFPKKTGLTAAMSGGSGGGSGLARGGGGGITINFNPTINMGPGSGAADMKQQLLKALKDLQPDIMRLVKEGTDQEERRRFA